MELVLKKIALKEIVLKKIVLKDIVLKEIISKVYNSKKYDIKEDSLKNGDSEEYDPKKKSKGDSFKKVKTYPPYDYVILEDVQKANENAKVRCIGMTFETRPDFCKIEDVNRMLKMGVTRVELGVQTLYDDIYEKRKEVIQYKML